MSAMQKYLTERREQCIERDLEAWARWCGGLKTKGGNTWSYVPKKMFYGESSYQRWLGISSNKTNIVPSESGIETEIERALWRYQKGDGLSKEGRHVSAFRLKYLSRYRNREAADEIKVSVATYKRYIANVYAYLCKEVFDALYNV